MSSTEAASVRLTEKELQRIKNKSSRKAYKQEQSIFSEGDTADEMYFIETGRVSIFIQEFTVQDEVSLLGPGDLFGEMAFFCGDKRSASAVAREDTVLLCIDRAAFLDLYETDKNIAARIDEMLAARNWELSRRETLIEHPGVKGQNFYISIKGDPSMRESVFSRDRYESVVDQYLPLLQLQLYDLLAHRCAYEVSVHFNSGELHVSTVFDPFNDEVHPASKVTNKAYVARHFQLMDFAEKTQMVRRLYDYLGNDPGFERMQTRDRSRLLEGFRNWQPVAPSDIALTISTLPLLRKVPYYYLRNCTISMIRDAFRMQFNCDGAHFMRADDCDTFIEQNVIMDEVVKKPTVERRKLGRRTSVAPSTKTAAQIAERRTPPGRRRTDWVDYASQLVESAT